MKYCSIDIETCGLDNEKNDILEFGAVLDNGGPVIADLPRFHCYFLPQEGDVYSGSAYALSMHPKIFRRIADRETGFSYVHPRSFGYRFKTFLINNGFVAEHDRVTINVAGKNFAAFDLQFLLNKTDLDKHVKIRHRIIDPAVLYYRDGDESLPGTEECKKRLNELSGLDINTHVEHTAIEDALDVVLLVRYALDHNMFVC